MYVEGVRLADNIFVQRLISMMNHCWSHNAAHRPTFHHIRTMLDPFRGLLDEYPPLPVLWTASLRLNLFSHIGALLSASDIETNERSPRSSGGISPRGQSHSPRQESPRLNSAPTSPSLSNQTPPAALSNSTLPTLSPRTQPSPRQPSPRGTVASIAALALANVAAQHVEDKSVSESESYITIQQLSEKLDIGGGAITAGDWRVFFPPQLMARLEDRLIIPPHMSSPQQAFNSVSALLRLIATFSRRLLPELEWQDLRVAINVHTLDDLARYIDACFPSLASHVYLVLRHFRPDLFAGIFA